jgi:biotin-independent malonate decarboxylase gamma subunit
VVVSVEATDPPLTRGRSWLWALAGAAAVEPVIPSILSATTATARYLAVVPDPDNRFYRARQGQVGVTESLALAQAVHDLVEADKNTEHKRAIIAVVDLPSQAYGRYEEMAGLHQAMAAATDAYHGARTAGPVRPCVR